MGTHDATRALWLRTFERLGAVRRRVESGRISRDAELGELLEAVNEAASAAWAGYVECSERIAALEARLEKSAGE